MVVLGDLGLFLGCFEVFFVLFLFCTGLKGVFGLVLR